MLPKPKQVIIIHNLTDYFKKGDICTKKLINDRGDFKLIKDNVESIFGFAYNANITHIDKSKINKYKHNVI